MHATFRYYVYKDFGKVSGPHSIYGRTEGDTNPLQLKFPRWVRKIDTVIKWHRNKRTYFFSGAFYWRYDNKLKKFDKRYPRRTRRGWRGSVPRRIDAAFSSEKEKKTYFISGNRIYMMDDK